MKSKDTAEYDFTATGDGFELAGRIALTGDTPNPPALMLNPPTLPPGKVGDPYTAQLVATGGKAPYAYAVTDGSLPPGLALDGATGVITGTPTTDGSRPLVATATDQGGQVADEAYLMTTAPADPIVPASVFTVDDWTYLGAFRIPLEFIYWTETAYGCIAGRKVNGQVELLMTGNEPYQSPVIGVMDPGQYSLDYLTAPITTCRIWSPEFRARRGTYMSGYGRLAALRHARKRLTRTTDPKLRDILKAWISTIRAKSSDDFYQFPINQATNGGLYWSAGQNALVLEYHDQYNTTGRPDQNVMLVELHDDMTTAGYGPWRHRVTDNDGKTWVGSQRCMYFTAHPDTGESIFGATLQSGNNQSPWGPDLYGPSPWPTKQSPTGIDVPDFVGPDCWLEHYCISLAINGPEGTITGPVRAMRRFVDPAQYDFYEGDASQGIGPDNPVCINVAKYGYGSWTDLDFVSSVHWIRSGSKSGILFFGVVQGSPNQNPNDPESAHVWYMNANKPVCPDHGMSPALAVTGPTGTHAFPFLCCYDPAELEKVRRKEIPDYSPEPVFFANLTTQFGIRSAPETTYGAARNIHGGYFDPDTSRFYALTHRADNSNYGTNGALFHVWQVGAGQRGETYR